MVIEVDFSKDSEKTKLYKVLKNLKPVRYILEIKKYKETRGLKQNKYYWGVVIKILSQETGFFEEEMHEVLKKKFNPISKVVKQTGEETVIGGSTARMNSVQFEEYLERVRVWALSDLDCYIPLPNEVVNMSFMRY